MDPHSSRSARAKRVRFRATWTLLAHGGLWPRQVYRAAGLARPRAAAVRFRKTLTQLAERHPTRAFEPLSSFGMSSSLASASSNFGPNMATRLISGAEFQSYLSEFRALLHRPFAEIDFLVADRHD